LPRGQGEILAKAGACESLCSNRAQVFFGAEMIVRRAQAQAEERGSGQIGLFGGGAPEALRLPDIADWPQMERLNYEAEAIGFHISAHPLDMYGKALKRLGVAASSTIETQARLGARIRLAGTVTAKKERITRTGSRMMWVTFSDIAGAFEVTLFSEVLARARDLIIEGNALLVSADARMDGESLRLTANDIEPLDEAAARAGAGLRIFLERSEALPQIRAILEREGRGKGRVSLVPKTDLEHDLDVVLPGMFNVSPRLAQAMGGVPGVAQVEEV
jgi:DNA polymerase-3 subunit alpha